MGISEWKITRRKHQEEGGFGLTGLTGLLLKAGQLLRHHLRGGSDEEPHEIQRVRAFWLNKLKLILAKIGQCRATYMEKGSGEAQESLGRERIFVAIYSPSCPLKRQLSYIECEN